MLLCVCAGTAFADFRQEYDIDRNFWNVGKIESGYPEGVGTKLTEHVGSDTHTHEVWGATTEIKVPVTGDVVVTFSYQGWSGSTDATKILGVDIINSSGTVISSDYHVGSAGSSPTLTTYTLKNVSEGGAMTLRYFVCNRTDDDHELSKTSGKITITGAVPMPAVEIDVTKIYRIKAAKADFYMEIVNFDQTSDEGAFRFKSKNYVEGQFFVFEKDDEDSQYYIKNYNNKGYMSAAGWDFYAKAEKPEDSFFITEVAEYVYTFYQDYAKDGFVGYCGNNGASVSDGTYIYNNVGTYSRNNTTWILEEVTSSGVHGDLTKLIETANTLLEHEYLLEPGKATLSREITEASSLTAVSSVNDLLNAYHELQSAIDDAIYCIHDVSDLNRLSNQKCYKVYGERGFIYVQDDVLKGSNKRSANYDANNVNHHFAIIEHSGKYYLYSVGAKKFVNKHGNDASLVLLPDHEIEFSVADVKGKNYNPVYKWIITLNGSKINLSDSGTEGVYTAYEVQDEGNCWAMYDAGSFDPTEALAAFDKVYVTVEYRLGSKIISNLHTITKGETFQFNNPYDFTEVVSCTANGVSLSATDGQYSTTITEQTEIVVTLGDTFPYERTVLNNDGTFPDNAAWYVVKQHSNSNETSIWKYEGNGNVSSSKATKLKDASEGYFWCFVGNPLDLKIYNKAAGSTLSLTNTNPATMVANNTAVWRPVKSNAEGSFAGKNPFCLQKGDENSYLNNQNSALKYWGAKDAGSTIMAIADEEIIPQIAEEVKSDALATIALYEEAAYFVYTPEAFATAKNAIQNLDITSTFAASVAGITAIRQTMTTLRGSDKNGAPVAGDYIRFKSRAYSNYLKANDTNLGYTNNAAELTTLWVLEEGNDNNLKIKNVSTNKYIGQVRQSTDVPMQANTDEQFAITNQEDVFGVFKNVSGNDYAYGHSSNGKLVGWERSAHATQWIISQAFPLTVTYTYKGAELSNDKITGVYVDKGETYTIVNPYSSRGYVAIESCTVNGENLDAVDDVYSFKVTSNTTVTVNLTDANLPFTVSADYENAVWYYLQLNSSAWKYVSRATVTTDGVTSETVSTNGSTRPSDDNGKWAFVGDAINGFKILNKGAGEGKYLNSASSDKSEAQMAETDQYWIVQTGNGGFAIRHKEADNACLNNYAGAGVLKIWNNSGSPNGPGSAFRVIDSDLTKVKEIVGDKLSYSGPGYPTAECTARANLQNGVDNAVTVEELYQLLDAYCQTTEIEMPVSGKAYSFTNIMNDANQTKRYMKYTSGQKLSVSTDENDASVFVCHKIRDGVYAFVTSDGKVLTWFSKDDDGAYKEDEKFNGYSTYYATSYDGKSDWNEIKVTKNGTSIEDLGHLRLVGRRNKNNVSSFIVYNGDGTFDRAADSYYFNNNYSSAWLLNEVTPTNTDAQSAAIAKIQAKETLKASTKVLGEGLGKYHYVVNDEEAYSVEVIDKAESEDKVNEIAGTLAINLPETGKFYYIQSANTNQYLSNVKSNTNPETLTTTEQKSANNIFYFESEGENTYLIAYENGHYVTNPWNIGVGEEKINENEIYKQTKSFVEGQIGKYALKYFSDKGSTHFFTASGTSTDAQQDNSRNDAQWNLEPVTDLPLTIHSSGKSTYSAPVDLEIPDGVTAYYAKRNDGETIRMAPLFDVIPANTGVVVAGAGETTVNFPITTGVTALEENNLLKPVVEAKAVTPENGNNSVFVMATKNDVTGFYPLSKENNVIGGHKSYLEIPSTSAARLSIVWDDTETGIFETEGGEQNAEIYDLTGRRLDKPTKGVNVVGGKLVIK